MSFPRPVTLHSLLRRGVVFALAWGLAFPLAPRAVAQASASPTAEARSLIAALASELDPTEYDVNALALDLAFEDAPEIATWVRDNIALEVYRGLLRGPQGTLVAEAGNALDQSVLLARLLLDAGYEARVALGELGNEDARAMVAAMFAQPGGDITADPGRAADRLSQVTGIDAVAAREALEGQLDLRVSDTPAYAEALEVQRALIARMELEPFVDVTDELTSEAAEYAWVEYRLSEAEGWSAAHPAWPLDAPPHVTADEHLDGEVPERLQHRLRIEVMIERKRGEEYALESVMTPWERPVANMLGVPVVVGNTIVGEVAGGGLEETVAAIESAAFFAPTIAGSLAPGAQAFDLNGHMVDPEVAASAMAGVFQTVGEAGARAAGALGGLGGSGPLGEPFALTAQYVDFVLVAPGGEETRHRRVLFDRRQDRAEDAAPTQLLPQSVALDGIITSYTVMVTGGAVSAAFVADQLLEKAEFHFDVIDELAAGSWRDGATGEGAALLEEMAGYVPEDHLQLFSSFDAVEEALGSVAYRAEPSVVALYGVLNVGTDGRSRSGVDVISNAKRVVREHGGGFANDVHEAVLAGAWDTVVEAEFLRTYGVDVTSALTPGVPHGDGWALTEPVLGPLAATDATGVTLAAAAENDLRAGYTVLREIGGSDRALQSADGTTVPEGVGAPFVREPAYWRVDRATGETLGMTASGRGNAMTEFLISLTVALVINSALAVPSLIQCADSGGALLCYCDVVVSGVALSLLGALLGALFTAEAMLYYAVVDIGVVAPITTLYTPPVCSGWAYRPTGGTLAGAGTCWAA